MLRTSPKHTIEELPTESEERKKLPFIYTTADENTSSKLLPDSLWMKSTDDAAQEVGIRKNTDNVAEVSADSGRKLLGVPPDLPETESLAEPKTKQKTEIISEIESILSKVKEQYIKRNLSLSALESQGEVSSKVHTPQSITDLLKLPASQINDETLQEDPVIEDARQRYMSIWNQEADRLNAPYMKVTRAWPELGMVYMPVVTEVTDQIKASESVKEAARAFKDVWERRRTQISSLPTAVNPMLKVLNNFMTAWEWAETAENTNIPEVDEASDRGQSLQKDDDDTPIHEEKLSRHDDSLLGTNVMNGFDSSLDALYKNIFYPKRLQPNLEPSHDSKPADPFATLGTNIMLSCTVVPGEGSAHTDKKPVPVAHHRPVSNPIANVRPGTDFLKMGNPIRVNQNANIRPVRQQTEEQKLITDPVTITRPAPDSLAVLRPVKEPSAVNRPINRPLVRPTAYSRPLVGHGVTRPAARIDGLAPVTGHSFNEGGVKEQDDLQNSKEDASHSSESDEQFIRRHVSHYDQGKFLQLRHAG